MKTLRLLLILLSFNCVAQVDLSMQLSPYGFFANTEVMYPIKTKFILGGEFGYNLTSPDINYKYGLNLGWRVTGMFSTEADILIVNANLPEFNNRLEFAIGIKITPPESNLMVSFQVTAPVLFCKLGFGVRLDYLRLFKFNKRFYMYRYPFVNDYNPN